MFLNRRLQDGLNATSNMMGGLLSNRRGGDPGSHGVDAAGQPLEKSSSADNFGKYSHHLGRAEFGTLRRRGISESGGGSRDGMYSIILALTTFMMKRSK